MTTYTYTARSAEHPERIVTFTLDDHRMFIDLGAPIEGAARAWQDSAGKPATAAKKLLQPALKPLTASMLERGLHPFDLQDVEVHTKHGGLRVTAWVRTGGLRLAPFAFAFKQVDNPEGAEAFAREVHKRQQENGNGKLPGPLDYWASWVAAGAVTVAGLAFWRSQHDEDLS